MSLLTDQDYFLQSLRLAFLRLDAPISTHGASTSHLIQSTPAYALSQHALYAGLTAEQVPEFQIAHSPGPIPSTSNNGIFGAGGGGGGIAGRRSPHPIRATNIGTGVGRRSSKTKQLGDSNGGPLPPNAHPHNHHHHHHHHHHHSSHLAVNGSETGVGGGSGGATGLKHSTTIVGRHGEKGAGSSASAGIRVKGKRSNWRPKPHQLQLLENENASGQNGGSAMNTPKPSDSSDTFRDARHEAKLGGPRFIFESPDHTPQSSRRPSLQHQGQDQADHNSEEDEYDDEEEEDEDSEDCTDEEVDNASSDTEDGLIGTSTVLPHGVEARRYSQGYNPDRNRGIRSQQQQQQLVDGVPSRPYTERALSEAIAQSNLPNSPTESYGGSMSAASISAASQREGSNAEGDVTSASLTGSSAAAQPTSALRQGQSRLRAPTLEGTDDVLSVTTSPSVEGQLIGEDSDDEEDDFEFSLPGREGASSLGASAVSNNYMSQSASSAGGGQGGIATFVSPPNNSILPSIAEAAEMNEQLSGNGPDVGGISSQQQSFHESGTEEIGLSSEDAALKAAQSARRRARRRVNISGRIPLKLNIPPSPELRNSNGSGATSPQPLPNASSRPQSPSGVLAGGTRAVNSPIDRPPSRPMSPSQFMPSPARLKSQRPFARQRAQTDPVTLASFAPLVATPTLPRTRSSESGHPLRESDSPLGTPSTRSPLVHRTKSLSSSPVVKASIQERSNSGLPVAANLHRVASPARAKSAGPESAGAATMQQAQANGSPAQGLSNKNGSTTSVRPSPHKSHSRSHHDPYMTFPIQKMPVIRPAVTPHSALSVMLRQEGSSSSSASNNPFNELYGALFAPAKPPAPRRRFGPSSNDDSGSLSLTMYYPFSKEPHKPIKIDLKPDAIVEEVIGCALWKYWEAERKPSLLPDAKGDNDEAWDEKADAAKEKLNASHYVLRIADEDEDGEVDDDFPAPERTRPVKGFGSCFAIVPASAAQARQNHASDSQIQRRPSRIIKKIAKPTVSPQPSSSNLAPPGAASQLPLGAGGMSGAASYISASFAGTPSKSSFHAASTAPLVLVRIRIPLRGVEDVTTAVKVPLDMYLADVLETLCKKRNLGSPKEWVLVVPDRGIVVPLDRTVESLQGAYNLALQRKSSVNTSSTSASGSRNKTGIVNTNPNASIFKRLSEPPQPKYVTSADLNTNYRSYIVQRKMPMPLGRHERVLSLDNDYIHIMPSDTKLASGTVRTASYHISQVAACKTSKRAPSSFKLIVWRNKDRDVKRYDFEAVNGKMATEIAQTIQALMQAYKETLEREQSNQ